MPRGSDVYKNPWLKAEDLVDDEGTFTITGSGSHTFKEADGKEKSQIVLDFQETEKKLGLNVTNYRVLESIFKSDDSDDWHGQKIVLFVTQTTMQDGHSVDCLRIKRKATEKLFADARAITTKKRTERALGALAGKAGKPATPFTQAEVDDMDEDDIPFNQEPGSRG